MDEGMVWNTTYHITYKSDKALGDSIIKELDKVGKSLNVFDSTSLVSRVNREVATPVDSHFATVYNMAKEVSRMTAGAFDPTLGPLIKAWGFGPGHKATADTLRIDSLLKFTGIERTALRGDTLYKDDVRTSFNFSAIAKGYGCDCVARMLKRNGVENYLVEIGGEIVAAGLSPSGYGWSVSVDRPVLGAAPDSRDSQAIIEFTDKGMATSGNYRNFHKEAGHIYGHTISATTGRPAESNVISATVLAPTCMEADALATAFMAMGSEKSRSLNDSLKLPVMLIMSDTTVWASDQFKELSRNFEKRKGSRPR
jgi:thiamine biosynthesis lipoprotein